MSVLNMAISVYKGINFQDSIQQTRSILNNFEPKRVSISHKKAAAVMILLLNKSEVPHIIFTQRTDTVETHKGQISFPGGVQDQKDGGLLETAKRETLEEIGIGPELIWDLGQLDDFFTVTDFIVTPFAGYVKSNISYRINVNEVAEVLEVPLDLFLDDTHFEVKKWDHQGKFYDVYFYNYGNQIIWGATAYILNRFIDLVFNYNPAPHPVVEDPRNSHYLTENKKRRSDIR
jgi:8-oxo-dGTP pyrophosphatase MutT (NUDIX family)